MITPGHLQPLLAPSAPVPDRALWLWQRIQELAETWNFAQVAMEIWAAYFGLTYIIAMIYLVTAAIAWLETRSIIFTGIILSVEGYMLTGLVPEAQFMGVLGIFAGLVMVAYRLLRS